MTVPRYLVDSNILVRHLTGDPAPQTAAVRKIFDQAAAGKAVLDISPVIVAETFYALVSVYLMNSKATANKLALLVRNAGVKLRDEEQTLLALDKLSVTAVDFADAYLAAGAELENAIVLSFDQDFKKLKSRRYVPGT